MKRFSEFTGAEGIDKLIECAPLVAEMITDAGIMSTVGEETAWSDLGAKMYKAHTEACNKLFTLLEFEPESSLDIIRGVSQILSETLKDGTLAGFFISSSGMKRPSISATGNTEDEQ